MVPLKKSAVVRVAPTQPGLDPSDAAILTQLRLVALECRAAARADLFTSSAQLSLTRSEPGSAFARALISCWPQALGKRPVFYRPGVTEQSFDEIWLLALLQARGRGDEASFSFMLLRRVQDHARRNFGFLAARLADHLIFD